MENDGRVEFEDTKEEIKMGKDGKMHTDGP